MQSMTSTRPWSRQWPYLRVAETQGLMGGYLELKGIKAEGRSVVGGPFLLPFAELVELDFDHLQVFMM